MDRLHCVLTAVITHNKIKHYKKQSYLVSSQHNPVYYYQFTPTATTTSTSV